MYLSHSRSQSPECVCCEVCPSITSSPALSGPSCSPRLPATPHPLLLLLEPAIHWQRHELVPCTTHAAPLPQEAASSTASTSVPRAILDQSAPATCSLRERLGREILLLHAPSAHISRPPGPTFSRPVPCIVCMRRRRIRANPLPWRNCSRIASAPSWSRALNHTAFRGDRRVPR